MIRPELNWPNTRQGIIVLGLFGLLWFSWASHARTLFNGLASPLFFALAAYLCFLSTQYKIAVNRNPLLFYILFTGWVIFVDAHSGEFLPALAKDSHWLILPLATPLVAQVFRENTRAFEFLQIGAALCIINLILTLFVMAEWFDNWHYPPIFGHIRHLGLSIGFLTILLFARTESSAMVGVFFRITRILGLALVFWSGTRASMLALLCCMATFIILDRSWLKILLIDTILAIALSVIPSPAFPVNQWTPGTVARTLETISGTAASENISLMDRISSGRMKIWGSTITGLADVGKLWTGVGGNGFARLQVMHGVGITPPGHIHPHNIVIQVIADWGLIGIALLSVFFFRTVIQQVAQNFKACSPAALAGIIYLLITGIFDATLFHLEHLIYFVVTTAYLFSQLPADPNAKLLLPKTGVLLFIVGLALLHTQTMDYRIGLGWYFRTS